MFATKELRTQYHRLWLTNHREYRTSKAAYRKNRISEFKKMALKLYDNQCQECGFSELSFLQFHHIKGTLRSADIIGKRESHYATLARVVKRGRQKDLELLCPTCHKKADKRDGTTKTGYWRPEPIRGPLDKYIRED